MIKRILAALCFVVVATSSYAATATMATLCSVCDGVLSEGNSLIEGDVTFENFQYSDDGFNYSIDPSEITLSTSSDGSSVTLTGVFEPPIFLDEIASVKYAELHIYFDVSVDPSSPRAITNIDLSGDPYSTGIDGYSTGVFVNYFTELEFSPAQTLLIDPDTPTDSLELRSPSTSLPTDEIYILSDVDPIGLGTAGLSTFSLTYKMNDITPVPEVSATGSLAAIASLLALMAFLWERRRVSAI